MQTFFITLLRRLDGQQNTHQIYLKVLNMTFGHKLLLVKKNVNGFKIWLLFYIKPYTRFLHLKEIHIVKNGNDHPTLFKNCFIDCSLDLELGRGVHFLILCVIVCYIWFMDLGEGVGGNVFSRFHCIWFHSLH